MDLITLALAKAYTDENANGSTKDSWEVINEITTEEDVSDLIIDRDKDGNPFVLDEICAMLCAENVVAGVWYVYIGSTGNGSANPININVDVPAGKPVVTIKYKHGEPMAVETYQYGYSLKETRIARENTDAEGNYLPQTIDRFRFCTFTENVLPAGTHVIVTGRRAKV